MMKFDELKKAWQGQDAGRKVQIDTEALAKLIRREQANWSSLLLRRDLLEVAICCLVIPFCLYSAIKMDLFTMYLVAGGALFVALFFIVDRLLQRNRQPHEDQPLVEFITQSIDQNDHQIWLLRNVFWWYLLPPGIGIAVVLGDSLYIFLVTDGPSQFRIWAVLYLAAVALGCVLIYRWVYRRNQRAVRDDLLPRKQELSDLLDMFTKM